MPIQGVTHDDSGRAIQRLGVSTKVAIGLGPTEHRNAPEKLDHFVFLRRVPGGKAKDWEIDTDLMAHYAPACKHKVDETCKSCCRAVDIVLTDDDIENVFPNEYAWWGSTEKKCWGDGKEATRRTAEHPDGQPWKPCGPGCPELDRGDCGPSADLYFMLADYPHLGSVCRLHTGGYKSVRQIHSSLMQIQNVTRRLAALTFQLVVRPEQTVYEDKAGKRRATTIYALSLELSAENWRALLEKMTTTATLFGSAQKMLGGRVQIEEDDEERAPEISSEFVRGHESSALPANARPVESAPEAAPAESPGGPKAEKVIGFLDSMQLRKRKVGAGDYLISVIDGEQYICFEESCKELLSDAYKRGGKVELIYENREQAGTPYRHVIGASYVAEAKRQYPEF